MTDLEQKIYEKLVETMDVDEKEIPGFNENSPIFERDAEEGAVCMNLDSIDTLEMVVMLEKEWGLGEINMEDTHQMKTVKDIAAYIEKKLAEK